ncbi:MAG: hypothetical protein V1674_02740 [Candidatus Omnitrophota bacterium]
MIRLRENKGFNIIGLMVTILIIASLVAIAVPNFKRFKIQANETAAVSTLMNIASAFETYRETHNAYPQGETSTEIFGQLPPLIDTTLATVRERRGYRFMIASNDLPAAHTFAVYAGPKQEGTTGIMWYKIDQTGSVYCSTDVVYDATTGSLTAPYGWHQLYAHPVILK